MTADLHALVHSTLLTWVMLLTASTLRWRSFTARGLALSLGNRDESPEPSRLAARADRAARNMLENLVLFATLVLTAHLAGAWGARVELGSRIFFWARAMYFPVYLAGIPYLRTALWAVSLVGMAILLTAMA